MNYFPVPLGIRMSIRPHPLERVPTLASSTITRLNSGIFSIFELSLWTLNLNSSKCKTSKIITNDTELELFFWELNIENPFLSFCVGVWLGGHQNVLLNHFYLSKLKKLAQQKVMPILIPGIYRSVFCLWDRPLSPISGPPWWSILTESLSKMMIMQIIMDHNGETGWFWVWPLYNSGFHLNLIISD